MRKVTEDAANDLESRYAEFALPSSVEKPRPVKTGEGLSAPWNHSAFHRLIHTHTPTVLKFDCDSVFIHNCKLFFGEFDWASCSPPSFSTSSPSISPPLSFEKAVSTLGYTVCTSSNHGDCLIAQC